MNRRYPETQTNSGIYEGSNVFVGFNGTGAKVARAKDYNRTPEVIQSGNSVKHIVTAFEKRDPLVACERM